MTTNKRRYWVTEISGCDTCLGTGGYIDSPPCPDCNGTGEIRTYVSLEDALAALGVMDIIDRANNAAKRAAYEASCLANGIQPD